VKGFTLVEVMVAVGIAALLITGVAAVTQSTIRTIERQKSDAREQEQRARAIEILRQDWRGRVRILPSPAATRKLVLVTTADGLVDPSRRSIREVTYAASDKGFLRLEEGSETALIEGSVQMEFWDGLAWRSDPGAAFSVLRLLLEKPSETVVLR
jgi:prepilin-type N-terminal cleavage/methylation domain-containing protein